LPLIGIILLIYILANIDMGKIINLFSQIPPLYSLLSLFASAPIILLTNYQWQLLLRKQKINISHTCSIKNLFIGFFYGFITPGGLGGYTRVFHLKDKSGEPLEKCLSNLIILNTINFISLLLLGIIGGFILSSKLPYLLPIITTIFLIELVLFLVFLKKDIWKRFFKKILNSRFLNSFGDKINISIDAFYKDFPKHRDILYPFTVSTIGWIVNFSELYLISRLFSINVPYMYFILIASIVSIIASIPITIYGLGTREITFIALFSSFNVMPEKIIGLSLFWFIIIWVIPSVIGAVITVIETRSNQ